MADTLDRVRQALLQPAHASSDFDLNKNVELPPGRKLRPAGVLAAIVEGQSRLELLLTMRSSALKHHPGQIAFPGGKQDEGDADVIATAVREAQEEIGLPPDHVEILGTLPQHETVTSFHVTPVIGLIKKPFQIVPEQGEVAEVFSVPLEHVLNPDNFMVQSRTWFGQKRHYYVVPFGPYYIWGATARMLRSWADLMKN